jgi:hypothetical protein
VATRFLGGGTPCELLQRRFKNNDVAILSSIHGVYPTNYGDPTSIIISRLLGPRRLPKDVPALASGEQSYTRSYDIPWDGFMMMMMINSSFIIHHSSFIIHHSSFIIHQSSVIINHSSFISHHSSFIIHHSSFIVHHLSFIVHHSWSWQEKTNKSVNWPGHMLFSASFSGHCI